MAECVLAVARRLHLDQGASELALVGGVFQAGDLVLTPFTRAVHDRLPNCILIPAELPPVLGAGVLALALHGIVLDAERVRSLRTGG